MGRITVENVSNIKIRSSLSFSDLPMKVKGPLKGGFP